MLRPTALPWGKPRRELLLLALVAVAALTPLFLLSTQDLSHYCLSKELVHGRLGVEPCAGNTSDIAVYGRTVYSNKAPGLGLLAVPATEIAQLPAYGWQNDGDVRVWLVRVLTSGLAFLACVFLVGRVAEGLAAGTGAPTLVVFAVGTLVMPFAASGFDHVVTAALAFAAFVLAWSRRPLLAGLAAGIAYLTEYEAVAVGIVVALYVALLGLRPFARYVAGALPPIALSLGYSWAAFGRPWHVPQDYDVYTFANVQAGGLIGVHLPSLHSTRLVFVGDRGILVTMPVLIAAAAGLWLLWRRGARAEALVCAAVGVAFVVGETGYGDPYGGLSPGPRYLIPALPFLAVGLPLAFERWRLLTPVFGALSVVAVTALTLTWSQSGQWGGVYRNTVWGELARLVRDGSGSRVGSELANNIVLSVAGSRNGAAVLVAICAAAAYGLSLRRS